jgi:hypothetical protein
MTKEQLDIGNELLKIIANYKALLELHADDMLAIRLVELDEDDDDDGVLDISTGLYKLLENAMVCSLTSCYNEAVRELE